VCLTAVGNFWFSGSSMLNPFDSKKSMPSSDYLAVIDFPSLLHMYRFVCTTSFSNF
jgi:hypothetical protein